MKRKIVQVAGKTLVVSIPTEIVKRCGLKKGDELELEDRGKELVMHVGGSPLQKEEKAITLDVLELKSALKRVTGATYKGGYTSVDIMNYSDDDYELIREVVSMNTGYEIVEKTDKRISIKLVSRIDDDNFDTIMRRLMLTIITNAEDLIVAMEKKDTKKLLTFSNRDVDVNRYADFCRRTVNLKKNVSKEDTAAYVIAEQLEKVGDTYRDLSLLECTIDPDMKKTYVDVLLFVRMFHDLYFSFSYEKLDEFIIQRESLHEAVAQHLRKSEPTLFYVMLRDVVETLYNLNGALITRYI